MKRGLAIVDGAPVDRARAVLAEADAALAGWSCEASTDCCRFAVTGREPWVTAIEWQLVVDEVARSGRRLESIARAAEKRAAEKTGDLEERCPFLSDAGKCTVYAARPLGCRTFYCERAVGPNGLHGTRDLPSKELRALPAELDALSTAERATKSDRGHGDDDGKARPLRSWLATHGRGGHPTSAKRRRR